MVVVVVDVAFGVGATVGGAAGGGVGGTAAEGGAVEVVVKESAVCKASPSLVGWHPRWLRAA